MDMETRREMNRLDELNKANQLKKLKELDEKWNELGKIHDKTGLEEDRIKSMDAWLEFAKYKASIDKGYMDYVKHNLMIGNYQPGIDWLNSLREN